MKEECPICCEVYTKTRKPIECGYCQKAACLSCAKTYIATEMGEPHCMHCRVAWNEEFIRSHFPKSWLSKEYKALREKLLLDVECSKIPHTQHFCAIKKQLNELKSNKDVLAQYIKELKEEHSTISNKYEECNQEIWMRQNDPNLDLEQLKDDSHAYYKKMIQLRKDIDTNVEKLSAIQAEIVKLSNELGNNENMNLTSFRFKCININCRGFLTKDWKCGICSTLVCSWCHEKKEKEHKCNEENVKSVELMKEDSKQCPNMKCGIIIYRIAGCDSMFCTHCKTHFNWTTGQISDTAVHNPHYIEYIRNQQAGQDDENALQFNCGHVMYQNTIFILVSEIQKLLSDKDEREFVLAMIRLLSHIQEVEIPHLETRDTADDPNRMLRLSYMMNDITKEEFGHALFKRERDSMRKQELRQIFNMFFDVGDDLLRSLLQRQITFSEYKTQCEALRDYSNASFAQLSDMANKKKRQIAANFSTVD